MPRPKKESKPFNLNMSIELWNQIEEYNKKTRMPKTVIVEQALEDFFKKHPLEKD